MTINNNVKEASKEWKIGEMVLGNVTEYTYLGETITADGKLTAHIKKKEAAAEGLLQQTVTIAKESVLQKTKMTVLLKIYNMCIIPAVTYACETWNQTERIKKTIQGIQNRCLRRVLKVPDSTPIPALLWDTGCIDIYSLVGKRQMGYLHRVLRMPDHRLTRKIMLAQYEYY